MQIMQLRICFCLKSSRKSLKGVYYRHLSEGGDRVDIIRFAIKRLTWFLLVKEFEKRRHGRRTVRI